MTIDVYSFGISHDNLVGSQQHRMLYIPVTLLWGTPWWQSVPVVDFPGPAQLCSNQQWSWPPIKPPKLASLLIPIVFQDWSGLSVCLLITWIIEQNSSGVPGFLFSNLISLLGFSFPFQLLTANHLYSTMVFPPVFLPFSYLNYSGKDNVVTFNEQKNAVIVLCKLGVIVGNCVYAIGLVKWLVAFLQ